MASKTQKPVDATEQAAAEETPDLADLTDDVREVFQQEIPLRSDFKQELNGQLQEQVEKVTGKSMSPERDRRSGTFAQSVKHFFHFPWSPWAYGFGAVGLVVVIGAVSLSPRLLSWLGQKSVPSPVYADAEIVLEKQGDTDRGVTAEGTFVLRSKRALDTQSVEDNFTIQPALAGHFAWEDGNRVARFVPETKLATGTVYQVTVAKGAKDTAGDDFGRDLSWSFQTVPTFTITGTTPVDLSTSAPRETTVEIEFNYRSVSLESFKKLFTIEPAVEGTFEKSDNKIIFLPSAPLATETVYRVTVSAGLGNGEGQTLAADKSFEFQVQSDRYVSGNTQPWYDFSNSTGGLYTWVWHPDDRIRDQQNVVLYYSNFRDQTTVDFTLSRTDMEMLLQSRVWQEDRIQKAVEPDPARLELVQEWSHDLAAQERVSGSYGYYANESQYQVELPELESGVYFLKATTAVSEQTRFVYIVVTDEAINYSTDQQGSVLLYLADSPSRMPLGGRTLSIYSLKNELTRIQELTTDEQGAVRSDALEGAEAIVSDGAVVLINGYGPYGYYGRGGYGMRPLNSDYSVLFATDRPLYKPGDTVAYKVVLRENHDGLFQVPPVGTQVVVKSSAGKGGYSETKTIDNAYGSVSGEFTLSSASTYGSLEVYLQKDEEVMVGQHDISISYYRKPEYELKASADSTEIIAGDSFTATGSVRYFFGQPVSGREVTYRVYRNVYSEKDPENTWAYSDSMYWYGGEQVAEGSGQLDADGALTVTVQPDLSGKPDSYRYSVEFSYVDELQVPNVESVNVIVHRASTYLYREADSYSYTMGDQVTVNARLYDSMTQESAKQAQEFRGTLTRVWYDVTGQTEHRVYDPATKTQVFWMENIYTRREAVVDSAVVLRTGASGLGSYTFTASAAGTYYLTANGTDSVGRPIPVFPNSYYTDAATNALGIWVAGDESTSWWQNGQSDISVTTDQDTYRIGDTVQVTVASQRAGGSALVTIYKGDLIDYKVVDLSDASATFEIPVTEELTPSFAIMAVTPQNGGFAQSSKSVNIDMSYKRLTIQTDAEDRTYLPGEDVTISLDIKNQDGQGVAAEAVVYLIDKALLALQEENSTSWFDTLYAPQWYYLASRSSFEDASFASMGAEGGGCFAAGTLVRTPDGQVPIETLRPGDTVLSYDLKTGTEQLNTVVKLLVHPDYQLDPLFTVTLSTGDVIQVTGNHNVWSETIQSWKRLDQFVLGENVLVVRSGGSIPAGIISMVESGRGSTVYNLSLLGPQHNYLVAGGMLVHNEKGSMTREIFKDSAAFESHVVTDQNGQASLTVTLPDNLTTWVIKTKAITADSKVGEDSREIVVSKKVVVSPSIPGFLTSGDRLDFTAIVHNFTGSAQSFTVTLNGDGYTALGETSLQLDLADSGQQAVSFPVEVGKAVEATFRLKALAADGVHVDEVVQKVPVTDTTVEQHSSIALELKNSETGTFVYTGSNDPRDVVQLSVSPTLTSSLGSVYARLNGTVYGSTPEIAEQLLTNTAMYQHLDLLGQGQNQQDIEDAMATGITQLLNLYRSGQGWGYFDYDAIDPSLTTNACMAMVNARAALGSIDPASPYYCVNDLSARLSDTTLSQDDKAMILYVLASAGQGDLVATQALAEKAADLQSGSVSYLALALKELHDEERGRALLSSLVSRVQYEDGLGFIADQAASSAHPQTKVMQTSLVLEAFGIFQTEQDVATKLARWLDQARRSFSWYQAFDQSQSMRGLISFASAFEDRTGDYDLAVTVNGTELFSGQVKNGVIQDIDNTFDVPLDLLKDGDNQVEVVSAGSGKAYIEGVVSFWSSAIPPSSRVSLNRVLRKLDGTEQNTFALGDLAMLEFQYDGSDLESSEYSQVSYALEGYLPAGFEIVQTGFDNSSTYEQQTSYDINDDIPCEQSMWFWKQAYVDRVVGRFSHGIPYPSYGTCGSRFPKITRVLVRASFTGEFQTRPSVLWSEDIPSAYAYSEPAVYTIKQ